MPRTLHTLHSIPQRDCLNVRKAYYRYGYHDTKNTYTGYNTVAQLRACVSSWGGDKDTSASPGSKLARNADFSIHSWILGLVAPMPIEYMYLTQREDINKLIGI